METLAVTVALGALFGAALWFADRCHARAAQAWQAAWGRAVEERKQLTAAHRLLVEMARNTQPLARAEEAAHLLALRREVSTMLNRVQVMLGVSASVDHDAETQKTPANGGVRIIP